MKICVEENLDADMIVQHRNTHLTESLPMTNKLICCLCGFKFSKEKFFANHVELCQNRELPGDGLQLPITKKLICSLCGFKFSEEKFSDNHVKLCQNYELAGDRLQENTTCQNEDVKKEVQSSDVLDNNLAMISIGDIKSEEFISIDGVQVEEKLDENTNDGTCQNKDVKKEVEINGLIDENLSVKPIGDIKPEELISIGPVQVVRKFDENTAVQYNNTHLIKNFSKEKSLTNHYKFCQNIEHSGDCLIQNGTSQNKDVKKEVENNGLLEENLAVKPIGDTNSENKMLFKCNICAFATTQSQYLNSHKRTKHAVRILSHNLCLTTYVNNQCQQPLYTCKHCDFSTRTSKEFITHITTHPPLEKIKCSQCNYFSTKQKLENHIKCYHTENQLKCLICNKPYPNRYSLVAHVKTHSNEESFKCLICHNTFRFRSSLDAHLLSHSKEVILHDHDYDTVRVHTFKCKRCDYSTTSHKEYQTHSKTHMFQCSLCSYAGRHLKIHMRTHTKEKPYKCSQCDYACAQKGNLALHMRRHTGLKPFKCAICDHATRDKTNLKKHEKIHTGERPYKCKICDYASIQSSALKLHMSVHTGDMPYKCTICGYATAHGPGLKMHLRIHTGERPYKCTICGYAATLNSGLKLHMSVHTGQKPFKCTICDYGSTKRSNLKVHMRIHAKQSREK